MQKTVAHSVSLGYLWFENEKYRYYTNIKVHFYLLATHLYSPQMIPKFKFLELAFLKTDTSTQEGPYIILEDKKGYCFR